VYSELFAIFNSVWMIDPSSIQAYIPMFLSFLNGHKMEVPKDSYAAKHPNGIYTPAQVSTCATAASAFATAKIKPTTDYSDTEIPENSVAVYPIRGLIRKNSSWNFSTKRFVQQLQAADNNPNIISHLMLVETHGGEAAYLEIAGDAVKNTVKPTVAHIETMCASAGEYLVSGANKIFASSTMDRIGSIGTMLSFLDMDPLLEKLGAKPHEIYATLSTLKNKYEREVLEGKYENYRTEVLDVYNQAFVDFVKSCRPNLNTDEKVGVLNGQMFFAPQAIEHGLIDGIASLGEALETAYKLGIDHNNVRQFMNA